MPDEKERQEKALNLAHEVEERATELAAQQSAHERMMAEERQEKAKTLAVDKALFDERIKAELADHLRQLLAISESQTTTATELALIRKEIADMKAREATRDQVALAMAKTVQDSSEKQISTRQFWTAVGGLLIGLGGLLIGLNPP